MLVLHTEKETDLFCLFSDRRKTIEINLTINFYCLQMQVSQLLNSRLSARRFLLSQQKDFGSFFQVQSIFYKIPANFLQGKPSQQALDLIPKFASQFKFNLQSGYFGERFRWVPLIIEDQLADLRSRGFRAAALSSLSSAELEECSHWCYCCRQQSFQSL